MKRKLKAAEDGREHAEAATRAVRAELARRGGRAVLALRRPSRRRRQRGLQDDVASAAFKTPARRRQKSSQTVSVRRCKGDLDAALARLRALADDVSSADSNKDDAVRDALRADRAAREALLVDADCQTGPDGALRFAHAPRGPRAITSRLVLATRCPADVPPPSVVRLVWRPSGESGLQGDVARMPTPRPRDADNSVETSRGRDATRTVRPLGISARRAAAGPRPALDDGTAARRRPPKPSNTGVVSRAGARGDGRRAPRRDAAAGPRRRGRRLRAGADGGDAAGRVSLGRGRRRARGRRGHHVPAARPRGARAAAAAGAGAHAARGRGVGPVAVRAVTNHSSVRTRNFAEMFRSTPATRGAQKKCTSTFGYREHARYTRQMHLDVWLPRARPLHAAKEMHLDVWLPHRSPSAIPDPPRSRSRSPPPPDLEDYADVLGRLSGVRPAVAARRPFR